MYSIHRFSKRQVVFPNLNGFLSFVYFRFMVFSEIRFESEVFTPFKNNKKKSWEKKVALVANRKIYFYENDTAKANNNAKLIVDIE